MAFPDAMGGARKGKKKPKKGKKPPYAKGKAAAKAPSAGFAKSPLGRAFLGG